jgi:hypothetical protein
MRVRIQLILYCGSGPAFHFVASDPIRIQLLFKMMASATAGLLTLKESILSLRASIASVHGPPGLHFELLHFDLNADQDPASKHNTNADPNPQP